MNPAKPTVCVLMSTYNGEKYLREQIDSILNQQNVNVILLVRDDGSTDTTVEILEEYKNKELLTHYSGKNLGPARSFMQLLKDAPQADFYAFADQDDYWQPVKLAIALQNIHDTQQPALYYCQTQLADKDLTPIESVIIHPMGSFGEALVYQFVGGCTMVMNAALRSVVNKYTPDYLPMHDIWIYDVALAIGAKVVFDPTPYIYYRQHNKNVIGQGYSRLEEWKRRFKRIFINKEHLRSRVAGEIKQGYYSEMPHENQAVLDTFINATESFFKRLSLVADKRFRTADVTTNRVFKLNVILNTY